MATKAKKKPKPKVPPRPVKVPLPEVLIPAEVAALLRVEEAAVLTEAVAGRLPGRCIAGQWRFSRDGLTEWLDSPPRPNPLDLPAPDETPAEQEAFLERMRSYRKASGKVGGGAEVAA